MGFKMNPDPIIWALIDERPGTGNQCKGVAMALKAPFIEKKLIWSQLGLLPNFLIQTSLIGLRDASKRTIGSPWPELVIASGRRAANVARYIKRKNPKKCHLVQIMHPGYSNIDEFDLIAIPNHDIGVPDRKNFLRIMGVPHSIDNDRLVEAEKQWIAKFSNLKRPVIGLIVGGATKRRAFNKSMAIELANQTAKMVHDTNGSLVITTSPRTGDCIDYLLDCLFSKKIAPSFVHRWRSNELLIENPYLGILAHADHLIVTGESTTMCSEACGTGKPVHIFAPNNFLIEKHQYFIDDLVKNGHAYFLDNGLIRPSMQRTGIKLDTAAFLAEEIRGRILFKA